tara:strand:- start:18389 stop:22978 length:4590 start_codon:yes stop_codon:yes gene_type:complete
MALIDQFSAESLLVIKKPPTSSPTIVTRTIPNAGTFLEDRFICFAYRYQYQNGEFSAVSQFSDPAFVAGSFQFTPNSFLNEGMLNTINSVDVTFETGSSLVTGIELLFKDMNDPTIKIVESFNKADLGLGDNNSFTFTFSNQKVFTVLPENEILRLFDNVPKLAQAQTIMGNRLVYGNYFEGNNLTDSQNNAVNFTYNTTLESDEIEFSELITTTGQGSYTYGSSISITPCIFTIDLGQISLKKGTQITWDIVFAHSAFYTSSGVAPTDTTSAISVSFTYVLLKDYNTPYELATDTDFVSKIGDASNVQSVSNSCNGFTFSDEFNCQIPATLSGFTKTASGVTTAPEGFQIFAFPNQTTIGLQILAMQWVNGANTTYEYYQLLSASSTIVSTTSNYSLHSNRGYEVGIIYMDEFNRSSTALVSPFNTVSTTCGDSRFINKIIVNIPGGQAGGAPAQIAPAWATRYKFCIKADKETYETIYVSQYVKEDNNNAVFFLLEGENANKVEAGDRLIVKADSTGVKDNCVNAIVLEKENKAKGFIEFTNPLNPTGDLIKAPAGTYMKIVPNNFSIETGDETGNFISYGSRSAKRRAGNTFPKVFYPVSISNPGGSGATSFIDYDIPAQSQVKISILATRFGRDRCSADCEKRVWTFEQTIIASQTYSNFKSFFDGENLGTATTGIIQLNSTFVCGSNNGNYVGTISYDNTLGTFSGTSPSDNDISGSFGVYFFKFLQSSTTGETFLGISGEKSCSGTKSSNLEVNIEVVRAAETVIFETQPSDALPDVWYENDLSFSINANGEHSGNTQDQIIDFDNSGLVVAQDAIIDTGFYNCISFGNGVESYKIRDSVSGKTLNFGNRTTTTSSQIYKEAHRFADLTYSGVFNDESNVNKLNEFNLGLANFSPLEDSFGPIRKLYSRRTDILTLQEDKISYVPVGKDLLTDAAGGGALTSVPQVLGVQIARDEEYGISSNPESFAVWGPDKYFVDAKRGVVIRLRGGGSGMESLTVISAAGMRSWFRDFFINSLGTQKLGGYDPYTDEFVLAGNVQNTFEITPCVGCDVSENLTIIPSRPTVYCVNIGQDVGTVTVTYTIPNAEEDDIITEFSTPAGSLQPIETEAGLTPVVTEDTNTGVGYTISAYYNNVEYTSGLVYVSGSFDIPKNQVSTTELTIEVSTSSGSNDTIEVLVSCPTVSTINVYNIAINNNVNALETIHNEYRWTDNIFSSPVQSNLVELQAGTNPVISQYQVLSGNLGSNTVPAEGSIVSIISNKFPTDTFVFNSITNKLRYLRSSTTYANTATDILSLVSASAEATPIVEDGNQNYATFTMPTMTLADNNLYLLWDYRNPTAQILCQDSTAFAACCNCTFTEPIPCDSEQAYEGTQIYPATALVTLGSATGDVTLTIDARNIPDRFILEFDGAVVIDTGYYGLSDEYNYNELKSSLTGLSDPISGLPYGTGAGYQPFPSRGNGLYSNFPHQQNPLADIPPYPSGSWPNQTPGYAKFTFTKTTATAEATLKIYGPSSKTIWNASITCPS